ncbi:MAG: DUF1232 domain-containing protein [Deltaproteobacteria bacterium]|nr:DUF1232 domain-containing protein [Deltaproteobacteria bacterium]
MATSMKITFTLDETDLAYFKDLFRKVKKHAATLERDKVIADVKGLIARVRAAKKVPTFVLEAIENLEALIQAVEDDAYALPPRIANEILAGLAYFSNPQDLVHDSLPVLGYLDDAIMIKFLEEQFEHELAGYRKFRRFRDGAEQRPWTGVAMDRLPRRLAEKRKEVRAEIENRQVAAREKRRGFFGW